MRLLKSNKCEICDTEITGAHTKPGFIDPGKDFYGNRVAHLINAECPCGAKYLGCLAVDGNGFKIIDLIPQEQEPVKDIVPPVKDATPPVPPFIDSMERGELIKYAKELGIEGKIATLKTVDLQRAIKEKLANGTEKATGESAETGGGDNQLP